MTAEECIKVETEKRWKQIKERAEANGMILGPMEELYFKTGVTCGISISGLALVNIDGSKLLVEK